MFLDELRADTIKGKFVNKSMSVACDTHTSDSNFIRWERFKTACYQNWVHIPYIEQEISGMGNVSLIDTELKFLVVKNGRKVDHPDVGPWCFDDMTEAMTDQGWKLFKDLDGTELVGTMNIDNETFEWQKPIGYVERDYNGDMYLMDEKRQNFCMTPNHRVVYSVDSHGNKGALRVDTIEDALSKYSTIKLPMRIKHDRVGVSDTIEFGPYVDMPPADVLKGKGDKWTDDEIDFVRKWYPAVRTKVISMYLGRGYHGVYNKAVELGLEKEVKHSNRVLLKPVDVITFAKLFGFWMADGGKGAMNSDGVFSISQSKERGISYLDGLFDETGWPVKKTARKNSGYGRDLVEYSINNKHLAEFCMKAISDCGLRIPREILVDWSVEQQMAFIEGFCEGDGIYTEGLGFHRIGIKDRSLLDDIQELLFSVGLGCEYYSGKTPSGNDFYNISLRGCDSKTVSMDRVSVVDYHGKIYCVTTPNDTVVTRRNGKVGIFMNCHNDMADCVSTVVADLLADQLNSLEAGSLTKVVGAAQGGYNVGGDGFTYGTNADIEAQLKIQSQNYYEQAGYGGYY